MSAASSAAAGARAVEEREAVTPDEAALAWPRPWIIAQIKSSTIPPKPSPSEMFQKLMFNESDVVSPERLRSDSRADRVTAAFAVQREIQYSIEHMKFEGSAINWKALHDVLFTKAGRKDLCQDAVDDAYVRTHMWHSGRLPLELWVLYRTNTRDSDKTIDTFALGYMFKPIGSDDKRDHFAPKHLHIDIICSRKSRPFPLQKGIRGALMFQRIFEDMRRENIPYVTLEALNDRVFADGTSAFHLPRMYATLGFKPYGFVFGGRARTWNDLNVLMYKSVLTDEQVKDAVDSMPPSPQSAPYFNHETLARAGVAPQLHASVIVDPSLARHAPTDEQAANATNMVMRETAMKTRIPYWSSGEADVTNIVLRFAADIRAFPDRPQEVSATPAIMDTPWLHVGRERRPPERYAVAFSSAAPQDVSNPLQGSAGVASAERTVVTLSAAQRAALRKRKREQLEQASATAAREAAERAEHGAGRYSGFGVRGASGTQKYWLSKDCERQKRYRKTQREEREERTKKERLEKFLASLKPEEREKYKNTFGGGDDDDIVENFVLLMDAYSRGACMTVFVQNALMTVRQFVEEQEGAIQLGTCLVCDRAWVLYLTPDEPLAVLYGTQERTDGHPSLHIKCACAVDATSLDIILNIVEAFVEERDMLLINDTGT